MAALELLRRLDLSRVVLSAGLALRMHTTRYGGDGFRAVARVVTESACARTLYYLVYGTLLMSRRSISGSGAVMMNSFATRVRDYAV